VIAGSVLRWIKPIARFICFQSEEANVTKKEGGRVQRFESETGKGLSTITDVDAAFADISDRAFVIKIEKFRFGVGGESGEKAIRHDISLLMT